MRVVMAFKPDPRAVTPDYWEYSRRVPPLRTMVAVRTRRAGRRRAGHGPRRARRWRFVQRVASATLTVFSTQQMLHAIGLGAQRSLPTAAALNWVLKDGLGRLGKLLVATQFGRTFDADVKRSRFVSSLVYDTAAGIEMATPLFPRHFLLLATLANIGAQPPLPPPLAPPRAPPSGTATAAARFASQARASASRRASPCARPSRRASRWRRTWRTSARARRRSRCWPTTSGWLSRWRWATRRATRGAGARPACCRSRSTPRSPPPTASPSGTS